MPRYKSIGGVWKEVIAEEVKVKIETEVVDKVEDKVEAPVAEMVADNDEAKYDITGDGKLDEKDASLAGKVLNEIKKKKKSKSVTRRKKVQKADTNSN